jgi:hypothetical protein
MATVLRCSSGPPCWAVRGGCHRRFGKDWVERRNRLDENLRAKRADLYMKLWQLSGILPRWPRDRMVTYQALEERSGQLRDWYY